jgi:ribosomal protein L18E
MTTTMNSTLDLSISDHMYFYARMNSWDLPHLEKMFEETASPTLKAHLEKHYEIKHRNEMEKLALKQLDDVRHLYSEKIMEHKTFIIGNRWENYHGDNRWENYHRVPHIRMMEDTLESIKWFKHNRIKRKVVDADPTKFLERCNNLPCDMKGVILDMLPILRYHVAIEEYNKDLKFIRDLVRLLTLPNMNKVICNLHKVKALRTTNANVITTSSNKQVAYSLIDKTITMVLLKTYSKRAEEEVKEDIATMKLISHLFRKEWFPILFGKLSRKNQATFRNTYL